jgi:ribosomal protein L1
VLPNALLAQYLNVMVFATEDEAARAIADRNNHLHECEESDRLNQLKEKSKQYEKKWRCTR